MANKPLESESKAHSVAEIFAHNISTPLSIALMNAKLLDDHIATIAKLLAEHDTSIPPRFKIALEKAPELIRNNLHTIQHALQQYKHDLNAVPPYRQSEQTKASQLLTDKHTTIGDGTSSEATHIEHHLPAKALRILLVDDEDIHHDIGTAVLGEQHILQHEKSGPGAINCCSANYFDVILMDMQMPKLTGQKTTQRLRQSIPKSTLILGLTNMPIESKKDELRESGFNGFLEKPLKLEEFTRLLSTLNTM
ncbi:MAG: CheY-like chemotaxis protein [Lentisphaeria bacterium]|jgi:CheY-like chemotaxis protein